MLPIHTILHPTDFSDDSNYAFRLACSLARDYGARIIVQHVAPTPAIAYVGGVVPGDPLASEEELKAQLLQMKPHDPQIAVERHLTVNGEPAQAILHLAAESKCDVIVMGTHGRTGLRRVLMGSVAERVVRGATCPVLSVKMPIRAEIPAIDHAEATVGTATP